MSSLGQAIFLAHLVDTRVSGFAAFAESSLTMPDWCALRVLLARGASGRKTNLSTMAALLGVSRQRGKQLIDYLVKQGFVIISEPVEKERTRFANVTERGKVVVAAIDAKLELQLKDALDGKPARAERLVKLLRGVEAASRRSGSALVPREKRAIPANGGKMKRAAGKRTGRGAGKARAIGVQD